MICAWELKRGEKFIRLNEPDKNNIGRILIARRELVAGIFCATEYPDGKGLIIFSSSSSIMRLKL